MPQNTAFSDDEVWVVLDYDREGKVWLVARSNLPGLHLQSETLEGLVGKIRELTPDLMADNLPKTATSLPLHIDIPDSLAPTRAIE